MAPVGDQLSGFDVAALAENTRQDIWGEFIGSAPTHRQTVGDRLGARLKNLLTQVCHLDPSYWNWFADWGNQFHQPIRSEEYSPGEAAKTIVLLPARNTRFFA